MDFLTPAQVAEMFQVSSATVRNLVKSGGLPGIKFGGKVLIPAPAVKKILKKVEESMEE